MVMKEIKKVDVLSVGKINGLLLAFYGLIIGIVFAIYPPAVNIGTLSTGVNIAIRLAMMVGLVLGYALMGFISGVVFSWLYNIVARKVGGVKVDLS